MYIELERFTLNLYFHFLVSFHNFQNNSPQKNIAAEVINLKTI